MSNYICHMKFIVAIFFCFYFFNYSYAQSKISIRATDSLAFYLSINNAKANAMSCADITLLPVTSGKTTLKIDFANPQIAGFEQVVELKPLAFQEFEIRKPKNKFLLFQVAESKIADSLNVILRTNPIDSVASIQKDEIYLGAKKCDMPMNSEEFNALKRSLENQQFEYKKLEILKSTLALQCITVEQLRFVITKLELEDNKVKIVELSKDNIFDFDRAASIADDFFLERNKNKVKSLFE